MCVCIRTCRYQKVASQHTHTPQVQNKLPPHTHEYIHTHTYASGAKQAPPTYTQIHTHTHTYIRLRCKTSSSACSPQSCPSKHPSYVHFSTNSSGPRVCVPPNSSPFPCRELPDMKAGTPGKAGPIFACLHGRQHR